MQWSEAYSKYNHNIFRHLYHIHRYYHQKLNDHLVELGYRRFKMSFIDVIPYLGPEGTRLTDLVELHQSPKATLARLINSIHHQGFIDKKPDPIDSRANILFINDRGLELVEMALKMTIEISDELSDLMGKASFDEFATAVQHCFSACGLSYPPVRKHLANISERNIHGQLQMQLNAIVKHIDLALLENNRTEGFDDLQNSHRSVLEHISDSGTRASVIAQKEGLTKQSISDISHVLLQKKYLQRINDPDDRRAHRLAFTNRGKALVTSSMTKLQQIESGFQQELGKPLYDTLLLQSERLWFLLDGQSPGVGGSDDFSQLETIIAPLLRTLLSEVQQNHTGLLARAFNKQGNDYQLNEALLSYIRAQKISAS